MGGFAQADTPVTDEFGCRVVYMDYTRDMIKRLESKLDSKASNTVASR